MIVYILRRIGQSIGVIWGIVSLLFVIFYALGDPSDYMVGDQADAETVQAIREKYGLDAPLHIQYIRYLNQLSPIGTLSSEEIPTRAFISIPISSTQAFALKTPNLGQSYQSNKAVGELIQQKLIGTLILALTAIIFAGIWGIILGIIAALNKDQWLDRSILSLSVLGISAPSFFMGVLIAWIFAVQLHEFTGLNVTGFMWEKNIFEEGFRPVYANLTLPALALGIRPLAVFIQLSRSSMIDVLRSDFIRTAKAKGLQESAILFKHAIRNALNPVITSVTGWFASLLAGAFFIEYIFNWQGVGKLTIDALNTNDFPVILGVAVLTGIAFVVVNLLTDVLYAVLDPRVELKK